MNSTQKVLFYKNFGCIYGGESYAVLLWFLRWLCLAFLSRRCTLDNISDLMTKRFISNAATFRWNLITIEERKRQGEHMFHRLANNLNIVCLILGLKHAFRHNNLINSTLRAKRATFTFWLDKSSLKMPKIGQFDEFLVENAKMDKFKLDILGDFQTMW